MNRRTFVTSAVAGVVGAVTSAVAGEHVRGQFLPPCVPPVSPEYVIPHLHLELLNAPMRRVARWKRIRSLDGQSYLGVHRDTGYVVTFDRRTCIPGSEWWEQSIGTHLPPPPFVWISRGVLWALMQVGNLVAAFLCRQGEYDADLCATRVAGCRAFEAANRRVNAMGMANDLGMRFDLPLFYQHGKLPDNLCRLMHLNLQRHREVIEPTVRLLTEGGTTGLFSTHPSDRDRIARSHRAGDEGVFQSKLPASSLFRNFEETSRRVTHDLYVGWFGKRLKIDALDPTDRVYDEIIPNPEAAPASAWS